MNTIILAVPSKYIINFNWYNISFQMLPINYW